MQQANAGPKVQKTTEHTKTTYDPKTGEITYKDKYNVNGPFYHNNCKQSSDSSGNFQNKCISN
jgi:hypothetical protein